MNIFVLLIGALFPFLSIGNELPSQIINKDANKTFQGEIYSNLDKLICGNSPVLITSTCIANDEENSDPYCFSQNVSFVHVKARHAKTFLYKYEEDKQTFIYGATCLKDENNFYIELKSSNLGNCKFCEWNDYFDITGTYIGSTNSLSSKTSFVKAKLTKRIHAVMSRASRVKEISLTTIEIKNK